MNHFQVLRAALGQRLDAAATPSSWRLVRSFRVTGDIPGSRQRHGSADFLSAWLGLNAEMTIGP